MKIEVGEKISVQLSEALKCMLTGEDYERIASQHGRSWQSVRQLVYRQHPVTEKTRVIVIALTRHAISIANKHGQTLSKYA